MISCFLLISNGQLDKLEEIVYNILHPSVVLAEFATFFWVALVTHFVLRTISTTVSRVAIIGLYNERNRETRIPIIL
jgi:hypothetical protein